MKRFHVHVAVGDLDEGVRFYSKVFGAAPAIQKPDYAKWMLEDPRLNFAISTRGARPGVNHLGFQLDSDEEFRTMHAQLAHADAGLVEEPGASCCYAKSDKYWVTDPAGIAWETFHTLGSIPVFGSSEDETERTATCGCCAAPPAAQATQEPVRTGAACCS